MQSYVITKVSPYNNNVKILKPKSLKENHGLTSPGQPLSQIAPKMENMMEIKGVNSPNIEARVRRSERRPSPPYNAVGSRRKKTTRGGWPNQASRGRRKWAKLSWKKRIYWRTTRIKASPSTAAVRRPSRRRTPKNDWERRETDRPKLKKKDKKEKLEREVRPTASTPPSPVTAVRRPEEEEQRRRRREQGGFSGEREGTKENQR